MKNAKRIYLAGPDVFFPNAVEVLETKKQLCSDYGFVGLSPMDNQIEAKNMSKKKLREVIKISNEDLIRSSDIVIANFNSFRGFEPDSGTCYEVGFASALQKVIYVYLDMSNLSLQTRYARYSNDNIEYSVDRNGNSIENFDFPVNLMFSNAKVFSSFEECLYDIKKKYN